MPIQDLTGRMLRTSYSNLPEHLYLCCGSVQHLGRPDLTLRKVLLVQACCSQALCRQAQSLCQRMHLYITGYVWGA